MRKLRPLGYVEDVKIRIGKKGAGEKVAEMRGRRVRIEPRHGATRLHDIDLERNVVTEVSEHRESGKYRVDVAGVRNGWQFDLDKRGLLALADGETVESCGHMITLQE